jgi:glycosyltransferase involved in cell wall biosynthesis
MKTILFISPTGTLDNGAEISIFNLMKYLKEEGYKVINVAPSYQADIENAYSKHFAEYDIECYLVKTQRWWWEEAPGHLFGTEEQRAAGFRAAIKSIVDIVNEHQVDVVISNTVNVFQGAVAAAITKRKHLWLIHEFPENEFAYYSDKIDFIDDYSTEIFSVDGQLKQTISSIFPNRTIKSFAPYTEITSVQTLKGTKKRIVSIGRISERKNQLELIQVFRELQDTNIELVFIGGWDEAYKRKCDEYIKKYQIKNISFLGNKENPWEKLTDQDLCVFPSAMETFGLVYVEALLNGIPVVLSDNPGHASAYEMFDFGHLYPTGDVDALKHLINKVFDNFEAERQAAIDFSIKAKEIYKLATVYKEIIEEINNDKTCSVNSLRHLDHLLTLDEKKSKLAKLEYKIRYNLQRAMYKLFHK